MKFLLEFAKFRDIAKSDDENINKLLNTKFDDDGRLIFDVFLEKYQKHIFIKWNNIEKHIMLDRIKNRTSFKSITEFNKFIEKGIIQLFNLYFYELDKTARYALHFIENNFFLLIDLDHDNLFSKYTQFFIPTITISSPIAYKIIEIDDDNF